MTCIDESRNIPRESETQKQNAIVVIFSNFTAKKNCFTLDLLYLLVTPKYDSLFSGYAILL